MVKGRREFPEQAVMVGGAMLYKDINNLFGQDIGHVVINSVSGRLTRDLRVDELPVHLRGLK